MLIDFRERGREGEREGEKHPLVASLTCPDWGLDLQPRHVPWPEQTQTFWVCGMTLQHTEPHQPRLYVAIWYVQYFLSHSPVTTNLTLFTTTLKHVQTSLAVPLSHPVTETHCSSLYFSSRDIPKPLFSAPESPSSPFFSWLPPPPLFSPIFSTTFSRKTL